MPVLFPKYVRPKGCLPPTLFNRTSILARIIEHLKADTVFLTHLHSDYFVGLPEIYLNGRAQGRATPIRVFGPQRTKDMINNLRLASDADIRFRSIGDKAFGRPQNIQGAEVIALDIEEGIVLQKDGVTISAFLVEHKHVKPAFGYRIDYIGRSWFRETRSHQKIWLNTPLV